MNWRTWFRRRRFEENMNAELAFHLRCQIRDLMESGLTREEAERRARLEFGAIALTQDECRDQRPLEWMAQFFRDLRFAARSLRRNQGLAAAVIVTLALGLGANTAIFSLVYTVLVKPLPYRHPEQIYSVEAVSPKRGGTFASLPLTIQAYLEWRQDRGAFEQMTVLRPWDVNLTGDGEPERAGGARVGSNFFAFLGVPLQLGRGFHSEEERPGNENVVVISDALWRRRYAADRGTIGRAIWINGQRHTVVGIAAPSLLVPVRSQLHPTLLFAPRVDVWKPIAPSPKELQSEGWDHGLLARLRTGIPPEQGQQRLEASLNALLRAQSPGWKGEFRIRLAPIREVFAGNIRVPLLLILAASGLLLLAACATVTNLFVARVTGQAHEFGTRIALGAARARIVSQILAETTMLALAGGAAGTVVAWTGTRLLSRYYPEELNHAAGNAATAPALLFAIVGSLLTGVACALFPAWRLCRGEIVDRLQQSGRNVTAGGRTASNRQLLIGAQMALATILLACAGLLLHSFLNIMRTDRGYEIERVLAVDLALFGPRQDPAAFYDRLAASTRDLPGVLAAGVINDPPVTSGAPGASRAIFYAQDTSFDAVVLQRPVAMIRSVTNGYFAASGTRLKAGRYLITAEPVPVALISESLAVRLWPGETPDAVLGRALRQGSVSGPVITVVGLVQDVRSGALDRESLPLMYRPYSQWASGSATLIARTAVDASALAPGIRAAIRKLNPNLPVPEIRSMREIVSRANASRQLQTWLVCLFALVTLILGTVSVYGMVSYSVTCRTRDIGLRLALGARRANVTRGVVVNGMRPVLLGLTVGLAGAGVLATLLKGLLFGIQPVDLASLLAVVLLLLITSLLACWIPARRAARLDPLMALRHE